MPIPPNPPFKRSNLSKQQKQQELEIIYGVDMAAQLTVNEIEKMRELLAQHDAQNSEGSDFDPSKVVIPYRYQKFPMMIYDHSKSYPAHEREQTVTRGSMVVNEIVHVTANLASKVVRNQAELEEHLEQGWSENPPSFELEPEVVEPHPARRRRQVA